MIHSHEAAHRQNRAPNVGVEALPVRLDITSKISIYQASIYDVCTLICTHRQNIARNVGVQASTAMLDNISKTPIHRNIELRYMLYRGSSAHTHKTQERNVGVQASTARSDTISKLSIHRNIDLRYMIHRTERGYGISSQSEAETRRCPVGQLSLRAPQPNPKARAGDGPPRPTACPKVGARNSTD